MSKDIGYLDVCDGNGTLLCRHYLHHRMNPGDTLTLVYNLGHGDIFSKRDTRFKSKRAGMVPLTEAELAEIINLRGEA